MEMASLVDELIEEILLRLPPSEPSCLLRAALACKRWRSVVSDAGFARSTARRRRLRRARLTPRPRPPRRHASGDDRDHLDCHGGPFVVAAMGTDLGDIFIYNYSSKTTHSVEPAAIDPS
nr:unnamed protein product [Digitaria exilis]